jgi:hypothetical protein
MLRRHKVGPGDSMFPIENNQVLCYSKFLYHPSPRPVGSSKELFYSCRECFGVKVSLRFSASSMLDSIVAIIIAQTESDADFLSRFEDVAHNRDLTAAFHLIILVNTNEVDP